MSDDPMAVILKRIEKRVDEIAAKQQLADKKLRLMNIDTIVDMNEKANDAYLRTRRQAQCSLQQIVVLTECYRYLRCADAPIDKIAEFLDAYTYCVDNWPMERWTGELSVDGWLGRIVASRRSRVSAA